MIASPSRAVAREEFAQLFTNARAQRRRTVRQFAEQEVRGSDDGPKPGRFRCETQPYSGLLFDAIDSRRFKRHIISGPSQSGKTLTAWITPTMYHLFEVQETVICLLPDIDMFQDKWREDLLPAIEQTRYREFLPKTGGGSRGGRVEALQFRHGPTLKVMSGGGGDKSRAGFTSRVLVGTEIDGMDVVGGGESKEGDKLSQGEARLRAHGDNAVIYYECTFSTTLGRTWLEYQAGTASRIVLPCPHCRQYVLPERDDFTGWEDAPNVIEAGLRSAFHCPACGEAWTEAERVTANHGAKLLHDGQSIEAGGAIVGEAKPTDTLGFRWSAVHNLFATSAQLGADEWKAARKPDRDAAEKVMRQFVWALPWEPPIESLIRLDAQLLPHRMRDEGRGIVPAGCSLVTVGADVNSKHLHYHVTAWLDNARPHVVEYGTLNVARAGQSLDQGLIAAIEELGERCEVGFAAVGGTGNVKPSQVWIDSGWRTETVLAAIFRLEAKRGNANHRVARYRPTKGWGAGQFRAEWYRTPKATSKTVLAIGEGFHFTAQEQPAGAVRVDVDADHWKTYWHTRLQVALDNLPGAPQTLFRDTPQEHAEYAAHMTAEEQRQEFVAGRGYVTKWHRISKANHYFDAAALSAAAGYFAGARPPNDGAPPPPPREPPRRPRAPFTTPSGQPFSVFSR